MEQKQLENQTNLQQQEEVNVEEGEYQYTFYSDEDDDIIDDSDQIGFLQRFSSQYTQKQLSDTKQRYSLEQMSPFKIKSKKQSLQNSINSIEEEKQRYSFIPNPNLMLKVNNAIKNRVERSDSFISMYNIKSEKKLKNDLTEEETKKQITTVQKFKMAEFTHKNYLEYLQLFCSIGIKVFGGLCLLLFLKKQWYVLTLLQGLILLINQKNNFVINFFLSLSNPVNLRFIKRYPQNFKNSENKDNQQKIDDIDYNQIFQVQNKEKREVNKKLFIDLTQSLAQTGFLVIVYSYLCNQKDFQFISWIFLKPLSLLSIVVVSVQTVVLYSSLINSNFQGQFTKHNFLFFAFTFLYNLLYLNVLSILFQQQDWILIGGVLSIIIIVSSIVGPLPSKSLEKQQLKVGWDMKFIRMVLFFNLFLGWTVYVINYFNKNVEVSAIQKYGLFIYLVYVMVQTTNHMIQYNLITQLQNSFITQINFTNLKIQQRISKNLEKQKVNYIIQDLEEKQYQNIDQSHQLQYIKEQLSSTQGLQNTESIGIDRWAAYKDMFKDVKEFDFNPFNIDKYNMKNYQFINILVQNIFRDRQFFQLLQINYEKLQNVMLLVGKFNDLRNNYFNNNIRSADILQKGNYLFNKLEIDEICGLNETEIAAFYFSLAIMEFDHLGVENDYLNKANHDLAILFNDLKANENHHIQYIFETMMQNTNYNIIDKFSEPEYKLFRKICIDLVYESEQNIECNKKFLDLLDCRINSDEEIDIKTKDKYTLIQLLVNCSKFSYLASDISILDQFLDNLLKQLRNQLILESEKGLDKNDFIEKLFQNKKNLMEYLVNSKGLKYFKDLQYFLPEEKKIYIDKIIKRINNNYQAILDREQ